MSKNPDLLKSCEARARLRCSSATLRRYLKYGHITAIAVNSRRYLYHRVSVESFLASMPVIDRTRRNGQQQ